MLRPVVTLGDSAVVLSLDVVVGLVTAWDVQNTLTGPVRVQLTAGAFNLQQTLAPGAHAALIAAALQWNILTGDASYSLTPGG